LSFHFVNKIFVSFNSAFNILLHTVHTHLLKLEVDLIFQYQCHYATFVIVLGRMEIYPIVSLFTLNLGRGEDLYPL